MFKGWILGVCYYSWEGYKRAYNDAVQKGLLKDDKGRKITKLLD